MAKYPEAAFQHTPLPQPTSPEANLHNSHITHPKHMLLCNRHHHITYSCFRNDSYTPKTYVHTNSSPLHRTHSYSELKPIQNSSLYTHKLFSSIYYAIYGHSTLCSASLFTDSATQALCFIERYHLAEASAMLHWKSAQPSEHLRSPAQLHAAERQANVAAMI